MKKLLLLIALLTSLSGLGYSQSVTGSAKRVITGANLPATCAVGDIYYKTGSSAGMKVCSSTNTWTSVAGSGGSVSGLTAGRVTVAASSTALTDYAGFTHDGTTLTVAGLKDTALTSGRVPFATTGGLLTDSANFTFDLASDTLFTVTGTNAKIRTTAGTTQVELYSTSGSGQIRTASNHALYLQTNNSTAQILLSDTNHTTTIGSSTLGNDYAQLSIIAGASTVRGAVIKLAPGQSADALQVQDSSGTVVSSIGPNGDILIYTGGSIGGLTISNIQDDQYINFVNSGVSRWKIRQNNASLKFTSQSTGVGGVGKDFIFTGGTLGSGDSSLFSLIGTFNDSGTIFTGIKSNITNTASATGTKLLDLQIAGTSMFAVTKAGYFGSIGSGGATAWGVGTIGSDQSYNIRSGFLGSGDSIKVVSNGVNNFGFSSTAFRAGATMIIGFVSNTDAFDNALDSAFSRISAGVIGVGTGAAGSTAGTLQATLIGAGIAPTSVIHAYTTGSVNQFTAERNTGTAATTGKATILHSQVGYTGGTGADSIFRADWGWSFQVNNQSSPANLLILTNSGKVGISNTNPTAIFQMDNIIGTTTVMMALKAYASQTADFVQYQNSSGTVMASVASDGTGNFNASSNGTAITNIIGFSVNNTNATTNNYSGIYFGDTAASVSGASAAIGTQMIDRTNHYGDFVVATRSAGGFTEKFRIKSAGDVVLTNNLFVGPSTIESFTTNASALGTLNYYTDSQTIYYDTAAATADVTINVDASASVDLNTRLATGQMVTVVLALTNTGTAYKCNTLQVHSVGQTIKWVGGAAPTGNINAVDFYTFTIMKTGASTYYVTGSQTSYK